MVVLRPKLELTPFLCLCSVEEGKGRRVAGEGKVSSGVPFYRQEKGWRGVGGG